MILQSAPRELTKEPVSGYLSQQNPDLLLQVSIVLKKPRVPVRIGVHEKASDPEPSGSPAHGTVSPQGRTGPFGRRRVAGSHVRTYPGGRKAATAVQSTSSPLLLTRFAEVNR